MYNRQLFTLEQQEMLDAIIKNKHFNAITSVFPITTPTQEQEIQRILKELAPTFKKAVPSEVERELAIELSKNPQLFDNPEVEKEWQAKLDAERKEAEVEAREVEPEVPESTEPKKIEDPTPRPPKKRKK